MLALLAEQQKFSHNSGNFIVFPQPLLSVDSLRYNIFYSNLVFIFTGKITTTMSSADIIYEKVHFGHEKWSVRLRPEEGGGLLCMACVMKIIEADEIAVRKRFKALTLF